MTDERRDRPNGRPENGRGGSGRPGDGGRDNGRGGDNSRGDASRQGDRRHFGRRRFGGRPQDRSRDGQGHQGQAPAEAQSRPEARPEPQIPPLPRPEPVNCPICGKPIYDLSTALSSDRENPVPAHFDCVLERVTAAESLGPGERVVYLGSGAFGVVEFKDKSETTFVVKRRIQWEKEGDKQDWRKLLSARISNL